MMLFEDKKPFDSQEILGLQSNPNAQDPSNQTSKYEPYESDDEPSDEDLEPE